VDDLLRHLVAELENLPPFGVGLGLRQIGAERLIDEGLIPPTLERAVIRPEQFSFNQALLQLTVEGERLWDQAWSEFRAG